MEKTREELEKEIEILNQSVENARGTAACFMDRIKSLENENNSLKTEISWLKQMIKGLVELSMVVLRGENNE